MHVIKTEDSIETIEPTQNTDKKYQKPRKLMRGFVVPDIMPEGKRPSDLAIYSKVKD